MTQMTHRVGSRTHTFAGLRELLAKASPARSGDYLAGVAAGSAEERVAAQMALAELPLTTFLNEAVVPYEQDEVTRLIVDGHDAAAFANEDSMDMIFKGIQWGGGRWDLKGCEQEG
mgnify:CR=1 FL=1